ncbi:uncharacterized protein LOC141831105 [Curcuma longa]|uniref:uncharacterized protein LOC141831105 n=1 Tax=Curcuma longa TaxID=136217 RepID=UPI003D9E4C05
MPTDNSHQPRLLTMTQEDFDKAVAAAVLAISRQQPQAPVALSRPPSFSAEAPPAPVPHGCLNLRRPIRPRPLRPRPHQAQARPRPIRPRARPGLTSSKIMAECPWNLQWPGLHPVIPHVARARILVEGSSSHKSPFAPWILEEELPRHFRAPQLSDYTGAADPEDHLGRFENAALLHQYTDAIKCRVFLTTLAGSALRWFNHLPPASICSFNDFRSAFLRHFATSRTYRKTVMDLFSIKQKSKESLKEYVRRFNQGAQEVPAAPSEVLVSAFSQGLIEDKYIHVEEAQSARRIDSDSHPHGGPNRQPAPAIRNERRPLPQLLRRPEPERPIIPESGPRAIQAVDSRPTQPSGPSRWLPRFCAYHRTRSHDTRDCHQYARVLREAEEQRTRRAAPAPQPRREINNQATPPPPPRSPRAAYKRHRSPRELTPPTLNEGDRSQGPCPRDPRAGNQDNAPRGSILMITGGATDGDSNRARKAHSRQLEVCGVGGGSRGNGPTMGFGPQDLEGVETPHDDALVIKATIANYDISRVFVDTGSSVNIIFKKAFDQMQIDEADLEPMATSLYGFTGNEVRPLGQIRLAISLGEEPARRTRYSFFTIVDAPSSYNVILGRPTLSAFSTVVSMYHQKIKFPVGDLVGEARGNQVTARRCYVDAVRTEARKARRTQGAEVHAVQEVSNPRTSAEKELLQVCPDRPETTVQVAAELPAELKLELAACLLRNQDVFAWTPTDLTGVSPSVAVHRLNVLPGARPIKQKRRHFGPEQNKVIREEVQKLLKAGHIKEVHFPTWLSNVVLVPKPGNKWRVCVDFRDLNKACPKDCYPLPEDRSAGRLNLRM